MLKSTLLINARKKVLFHLGTGHWIQGLVCVEQTLYHRTQLGSRYHNTDGLWENCLVTSMRSQEGNILPPICLIVVNKFLTVGFHSKISVFPLWSEGKPQGLLKYPRSGWEGGSSDLQRFWPLTAVPPHLSWHRARVGVLCPWNFLLPPFVGSMQKPQLKQLEREQVWRLPGRKQF